VNAEEGERSQKGGGVPSLWEWRDNWVQGKGPEAVSLALELTGQKGRKKREWVGFL